MGRRQTKGGDTRLVLFALIAGLVVSCVNWVSGNVSPEVKQPVVMVRSEPQNELAPIPKAAPVVVEELPIENLQAAQTIYVKGKSVALRGAPSKEGKILDRLNSGYQLEIIGKDGDWSKVRDPLSQRTGWIASYLLTESRPTERLAETKVKKSREATPAVEPAAPRVSESAIINAIIAASISNYSGSCPCPYNRDRGGRSCGKRSAYSKPGGASPICFAGDVSRDMIEAWRARMN